MKRLHIVGCPRSGTTLLMQLLGTCFEHSGHCAHEMSIFEVPDHAGDLYLSKQPNDIRQLQHIFFRDENLYVIYLSRDPRAVVTSVHRARPGEYFCNFRIWSECDRAAERYRGHPRFLALRYEDLVQSPNHVQSEIARQFAFLKPTHRFEDFAEHAQPEAAALEAMHELRAPGSDSIDKWRAHLPRLKEQYQRYPQLALAVQQHGYAADTQWLDALEGVEARVYPCRYPTRREVLKEWEKAVRCYLKSRRYLKARC